MNANSPNSPISLILARRAAAHEGNIRDLMAPTKSWFGLGEAEALHKNSMGQHLTNARAVRSLVIANVLRAEGFL